MLGNARFVEPCLADVAADPLHVLHVARGALVQVVELLTDAGGTRAVVLLLTRLASVRLGDILPHTNRMERLGNMGVTNNFICKISYGWEYNESGAFDLYCV